MLLALGIDLSPDKHPLAVVEGSTETPPPWSVGCWLGYATRGLDTTRPVLAVLDGPKTLAAAMAEVLDRARILAAWSGSWTRPVPVPPGSLGGGPHETLSVLRLGVPSALARSLRSTNPIWSMIDIY